METKTRWNSCRLAPQGESGRIRWCVGQERAWRLKVKIMVFVPILLLSIILLAILFTHLHKFKYESNAINQTVQHDFITNASFISHNKNSKPIVNIRQARDLHKEIFDDDLKRLQLFTTTYQEKETSENEEKSFCRDLMIHYVPTRNVSLLTQPSVRKIRELNNVYIPLEGEIKNSDDNISYWDVSINDTIIPSNYEEFDNVKIDLFEEYDENVFILEPKFWKNDSVQAEVRRMQAETMLKYMDNSVNPCDDFYQYACGNWNKYHPIPPDKIGYDIFEVLRESLDKALRDLLTEEDANVYTLPNKSENAILKVKNFFKSCMNEDIINQRGEKPLLNLLQQLGGWPIIDPNWNQSNFDWLWLMAQLRLYNNDIFISEWVGPDIRNANEYIIQIEQTTLGLPSKQYFLQESNLKYLEAYRVYMISVATLLGAPLITASSDVELIVNFEIELAKIIEAPEKRKNISDEYMRVTVEELHTLIPQIDWFRYFNIIMKPKKLNTSDRIVSYCTNYLQDLATLLERTSPRTVANYLLWRFVRNRINNLDKRFQEAKQRFYYVLFGREKSPPRWQTCVNQVNSNMGMALGSLFVRQYFDEDSKNDTLQMTKEIQQSFRELLSRSTWLDNDTKNLAKIKIDAMRLRIGYPEFILNMAELTERYSDITVNPTLYFENTLNILEHLARREHARLGTIVDKLMWTAPPAIVNAYYSRNKNQIMFPAGILQPPFYQRHFPRSLNYGGIGVVIGHEVTHGFDDKGRLFDKEGNLHRWWRDTAVQAFHGRSQCLVEQYNKYTVPQISVHIDGVSTQGENIADNGGLKQAYQAYAKWLEKNPYEDETLPGLNLSNTQMFFLNFAQVWCGSSRVEGMENKLKGDVHAPGRYRVIGSISNLNEFADSYSCPLGSPMNPKKKCSIW